MKCGEQFPRPHLRADAGADRRFSVMTANPDELVFGDSQGLSVIGANEQQIDRPELLSLRP